MASAYVFELLGVRACAPVRLWLAGDAGRPACGPSDDGLFDALLDSAGRAIGPGTWVGVTGLPDGYDRVTLEAIRSAGIAAIVTPLERPGCKSGAACFGITLQAGFTGTRRLVVRFHGPKGTRALEASRDFEAFTIELEPHGPVATGPDGCRGPLFARLRHVPPSVMKALGKSLASLELSPAASGIERLVKLEPTGPDSGRLAFTVADAPEDVHVLGLVAHCPVTARVITASTAPFFFQTCPRVVLRGVAAGRSVPAEPPARFRIGPFDGLDAGEAELVHAAFADLRRWKHAYTGKSWSFQLRVQPERTGSGALNTSTPEAHDGVFETTEGGDLGVVITAGESHARMAYAVVTGGKVGKRVALAAAANPIVPSDGTLVEREVEVRGAGVEQRVQLPDRAIVFFLDERELVDPDHGVLRELASTVPFGTRLLMAVHVAAPCGCVSRLVVDAPEELQPRVPREPALGRATS